MATSTSFKQQCPSCEAMVPIRDPGLIGRKIDCPKCKYRFVVEEPAEEDEDGKPKKGAKKGPRRGEEEDAKKAGSGKMLFVGVGLAGVALVAIIVCAVVLMPGDAPKANTGTTPPPNNPSPILPNDPAPPPIKDEPVATELPNIRNRLPNDTQVVISYPMQKTLGSSLGIAALDTGGGYQRENFRQTLGFRVEDLLDLVTAISIEKNWVFSIVQTKIPLKLETLKTQLRLAAYPEKIASKKSSGKTYEIFLINRELDSLSNLLFKANRPSPQFALYQLDKQTLVFADPEPLKAFLEEDGRPANLSDPPVPGAAPADGGPAAGPGGPPGGPPGGGAPMGRVGAGGGPPGGPPPGGNQNRPRGPGPGGNQPGGGSGSAAGQDTSSTSELGVSESYLTVEKDLKDVLDKVEGRVENKKTHKKEPVSVVTVAVVLKVVREPLTKAMHERISNSRLSIVQTTMEQFGKNLVTNFFRDYRTAAASLSAYDQNNLNVGVAAKGTNYRLAETLEGRLYDLLPLALPLFKNPDLDLTVTMTNPRQSGGGRGPGPGGSGMGPPGRNGPGMNGSGRGGMRPPGMSPGGGGGFPPGPPGPPGGRFGGPGGGFPGDANNDDKSDGAISVNRDDTIVTCSLELTLTPKAYQFISPHVYDWVMLLKSGSDLATTRVRTHDLAAALQAYLKETGSFPPGAMPRPEPPGRGLPFRPDQRLSWVVALLPYFGVDFKEWKIDANSAWNEGPDNPSASSRLVPHLLYFRAGEAGPSFITYPGKPGVVFGATHFVAISGVGLDAAEYVPGNPATDGKRGIFGFNRITRKEDVKDGLDKTIALLLVRGDHKAPWLAGGGPTVRAVTDEDDEARPIAPFVCTTWPGKPGEKPKFDGKRGTIAIMADGKVRFIPENIPAAMFRALCTIAGGEQIAKLDETCPVIPYEGDRELKTDGDAAPAVRVSDATKKGSDLERMQGLWMPKAVTQDGISLPIAAIKNARFKFSGSTMMMSGLGQDVQATFTIDSTKNPKVLDTVDLDGPDKGKPQLGIYELTDTQLKICSGHSGDPRPTSFTSTLENKQILMVFERASGAAPPAKAGEWKEFTPASKAFTVKMPGEVRESRQQINLPGGMKLSTFSYIAANPPKLFSVSFADYPAGLVQKAGVDNLFATGKNALLARLPAGSGITSEKKIKLGVHPGVQWLITVPERGMVMERFYLVGDRAIELGAQGVTGISDTDATTFFDSFKLGS